MDTARIMRITVESAVAQTQNIIELGRWYATQVPANMTAQDAVNAFCDRLVLALEDTKKDLEGL